MVTMLYFPSNPPHSTSSRFLNSTGILGFSAYGQDEDVFYKLKYVDTSNMNIVSCLPYYSHYTLIIENWVSLCKNPT